jgi:hypothetical protein
LYADIESLRLYAGIHLKPYKNYHQLLSKRFFIRWLTKRFLSMPLWIAAVIQLGCVSGWTGRNWGVIEPAFRFQVSLAPWSAT